MNLKIRLNLSKCAGFSFNELRTKLRSDGYSVENADGKTFVAQPKTTAFLRTGGGSVMAVPAIIEEVGSDLIVSFPLSTLLGTATVALVAIIGGLVVHNFKEELGLVISTAGFLVLIVSATAYFSNVMNIYSDLKKAISSS